MLRIEILNGPEAGRILDLSPGTHTLGRRKDCSFALQSTAVSGHHLTLEVSDSGAVQFSDQNSTNGTWAGGMKVQQGEWSVGAELKLGDLALRLLDGASAPSPAASPEPELVIEGLDDNPIDTGADAATHAQARADAMSAKRKGGPMMLVMIVLALGSGGAWWFFGGGMGEARPNPNHAAGPNAPHASKTQVLDAIDNCGAFTEDVIEDWSALTEAVQIQEGGLSSSGGSHRVRLNRRFDLPSAALQFSADLNGLTARPLVGWGSNEQETAEAWWVGETLTSSSVLPIPSDADWFELHLLLDGAGSLTSIQVEANDTEVAVSRSGDRVFQHASGNMLLQRNGQTYLHAQGGGQWSATEGGLTWSSESPASIGLRFTQGILETGSLWVLADGGPVALVKGMTVDDSPGFFAGGEAKRMIARWGSPSQVAFQDGKLQATVQSLTLMWDVRDELAKAAKASREIKRAADANDDVMLLASAARLLREWPFSEDHVAQAQSATRQAVERGRLALATYQNAAGEAMFLASSRDMLHLESDCRSLASRLPGTNIATEALALAEALNAAASVVDSDRAEARKVYRTRLQAALEHAYPTIAAWLAQEDRS